MLGSASRYRLGYNKKPQHPYHKTAYYIHKIHWFHNYSIYHSTIIHLVYKIIKGLQKLHTLLLINSVNAEPITRKHTRTRRANCYTHHSDTHNEQPCHTVGEKLGKLDKNTQKLVDVAMSCYLIVMRLINGGTLYFSFLFF